MTTCCGLPCAWAVADRPSAVTNKADRGMTAFNIASLATAAWSTHYNRGLSMGNERRLADGRVELVDTRRVEASPIYNEDLAPVPLARRTWSTYNYAALWITMAHCIPTYMLASA